MRKKIYWAFVILLFLLIIAYICSILKEYYSFADEIVSQKTTKTHKKDTLLVIFIGDSWAAYHSIYDEHLKASLERIVNKPTKVISRGTVGAKTKTIYNKMHSCSSSGTKELIELSPNYAIVSAGINDAVAKMGAKNYCHHYHLIIKDLLSAGIKPIIVDMPQVDYRLIYQRESIVAKIRHHLSSWITGAPLWSFEDYQATLRTLINQDEKGKKLIYIPASEWNLDGFRDPRHIYLGDHVHLNEKGYFLLDSCITSYIYHDIISTHDFQ